AVAGADATDKSRPGSGGAERWVLRGRGPTNPRMPGFSAALPADPEDRLWSQRAESSSPASTHRTHETAGLHITATEPRPNSFERATLDGHFSYLGALPVNTDHLSVEFHVAEIKARDFGPSQASSETEGEDDRIPWSGRASVPHADVKQSSDLVRFQRSPSEWSRAPHRL